MTIVDANEYLDAVNRRLVKSWIALEQPRPIPWTPLEGPIKESTVAVISTSGIALKSDFPFDQDIERVNPWWSDPSFRVIPRDAKGSDLTCYHLHISLDYLEEDINSVLPLERLISLEKSGEIGRIAQSHYTFIGYTTQPQALLGKSVPEIIQNLRNEQVNVVILVPV